MYCEQVRKVESSRILDAPGLSAASGSAAGFSLVPLAESINPIKPTSHVNWALMKTRRYLLPIVKLQTSLKLYTERATWENLIIKTTEMEKKKNVLDSDWSEADDSIAAKQND